MRNYNPLYLSKVEKNLVDVTLILGILIYFGSSKLLFYFMPIAPGTAITWGILRIIGNILMASVFAIVVYRMIRLFRRNGFTYKRVMALFACVVCVFLIVMFNVWSYRAVQNFDQYLESTNADMIRSDLSKLNQDLPTEKKSRLSFLYAQTIFTNEGRLIEYFSSDGKSITFIPSVEDQSNRNIVLFQKTYSSSKKAIAVANSLSWGIALVGAFGFGFKIQRKNEVN